MALKTNGRLNRREMLRAMSACAAGGAASLSPFLSGCRERLATPEDLERFPRRQDAASGKPKFLIVIAAAGGASIVDSFLAVSTAEAGTNGSVLNTFPDTGATRVQTVSGSPFRAVAVDSPKLGDIPVRVLADQLPFITKHKDQTLVATCTGTSVNHVIAQKRSLTGNGAWNGRTLQECVALEHGAGFPIPNVNMSVGGFLERGADDSLPSHCYGESVANASLWPLGLDGLRGIKGAPDRSLLALARKARNEQLDPQSLFARTFAGSDRLQRWYAQRGPGQANLEALDLITKLNILPNKPPELPLAEYGLGVSPDATRLQLAFPKFFTDPFEGQAAAAFLLLKYRVSVAVTIGPNFNVSLTNILDNPPLAFDFSHNDHRAGQAFMWRRILSVTDRLIDLLKAEPFDATESLWDRTLIYVATDFGRSRQRASGAATFGTGHDLNNGFVMFSPMVKGNTVLGGVDKSTVTTYGFDPESGTANPSLTLSNERDIFAGLLHTLSVNTAGSGLPDARAFRKVA